MLLHTGHLLQQYAVDMYIKIETSRLDYFRYRQHEIRADLYQGIVDGIVACETRVSNISDRIILPASFTGGPKDMRRRYIDAMALVQCFGKPDIFLTVTCNPSWIEIQRELLYNDEAENRSNLLARAFKAKLEELKEDLFKKEIFGAVAAYTYVIEFQKRGLPHAHFLMILKPNDKITSSDSCDKYISAELLEKDQNSHLYASVRSQTDAAWTLWQFES